MDLEGASQHDEQATPIFEAYRRGYDPDQVDRFVADQQRRLDETLNRATEAERRLAAAVGQLRELHRRVATLESEGRSPQPQPLDTLGDRIQRILQEAWEGAHAVRQSAEEDAATIRQRTLEQAEEIVAMARQKAKSIEDEIERRRRAYLGRIEEERSRAVAQITYLHDQRQNVVSELVRMKDVIETTVGKIPAAKAQESAPALTGTDGEGGGVRRRQTTAAAPNAPLESRRREANERAERPRTVRDIAPRTMPVIHLNVNADPAEAPDASELVRSHRAAMDESPSYESATIRQIRQSEEPARPSVFDFEEESPS